MSMEAVIRVTYARDNDPELKVTEVKATQATEEDEETGLEHPIEGMYSSEDFLEDVEVEKLYIVQTELLINGQVRTTHQFEPAIEHDNDGLTFVAALPYYDNSDTEMTLFI